MSTIASRWEDADREVRVRAMEKFYGDDLRREPPLVNKTPVARIFNWRMPQVSVSQPYASLAKVWHFTRITISDFAWPVVCYFLGHTLSSDNCCIRCGKYRVHDQH